MLLATHLIEISDKEENTYPVPKKLQLKTSDLHINKIELINKKRSEIEIINQEFKQRFKDKIISYLMVFVLLFIVFSIPVGIVTIVKWLI